VYLQTHSAESLTVFENRLLEIQRHFEEEVEQREFDDCVNRVRKFLYGFEARAETIVIICSSVGPLWVRQIDVPLRNNVRWNREPYWTPLIEVLDELEPYAVVAVEKFKARLLTISVGKIHEHPVVERGSDDLDGFLKKVIATTQELMLTECPNRLIVAGGLDIRSEFLRLAPWTLQQTVIGSIAIPADASLDYIFDVTREVERFAERRFEARQVDDLIRLSKRHKKVALGLPATLEALNAGRIWTLIYSENWSTDGKECDLCNQLHGPGVDECPKCKTATRPAGDLLNRMLTRALNFDASIEEVRGEAASQLDRVGGVGAFLRF
jgi:hypothetical protein